MMTTEGMKSMNDIGHANFTHLWAKSESFLAHSYHSTNSNILNSRTYCFSYFCHLMKACFSPNEEYPLNSLYGENYLKDSINYMNFPYTAISLALATNTS